MCEDSTNHYEEDEVDEDCQNFRIARKYHVKRRDTEV